MNPAKRCGHWAGASSPASEAATGGLRQPRPAVPADRRVRARPGGRVVISVYSSGAIGLVRYLRSHAAVGQ